MKWYIKCLDRLCDIYCAKKKKDYVTYVVIIVYLSSLIPQIIQMDLISRVRMI